VQDGALAEQAGQGGAPRPAGPPFQDVGRVRLRRRAPKPVEALAPHGEGDPGLRLVVGHSPDDAVAVPG
jgi:hypothetical protein